MSAPSSRLSDSDRRELLARARQAIVESVVHHRIAELPPLTGQLAKTGAAFVSLHRRGKLRGCVGRTESNHPLGETVAQCAISAANSDPRFPPVREDELKELAIEISVLTESQPMAWSAIEAGKHGLLVVWGARRGLLLPQVARGRHWSTERFIEETCAKAGLDPAAWRDPETQCFGFTVESFSETELGESRNTNYSIST
jgi:AmmeMemoRadiSam system protein A